MIHNPTRRDLLRYGGAAGAALVGYQKARAQLLAPVIGGTRPTPSSAITFINKVAASSVAGNTITTGAVDMTGANFLVIGICYYRAAAPALSDSLSNSYTGATTAAVGPTADLRIFYKENATVGNAMTFTATGMSYASLCVAGFSTVLASGALDQNTKTDAGAGGTTFQPGSITPGSNNEVVLTAMGFEGTTTTLTINGGFTITNTQNFVTSIAFGCSLAYLIQTSAAAANPTWTFGTSQSGSPAGIASFKHS